MVKPKNSSAAKLAAWLCVIISSAILGYTSLHVAQASAPPSGGLVTAVFDGDTVVLDSGEKIRYIGIDAPEVAHGKSRADCYGAEAKRANAEMVLHKRVAIRYDRKLMDVHGRFLGYVYLPDGRCVNEEMLKTGSATVYRSRDGFERFNEFLSRQREAIRYRRGMWGSCSAKPAPYYAANRRSYIFHRPACPFGQSIAAANRLHYDTRLAAFENGYSPCRRCKP